MDTRVIMNEGSPNGISRHFLHFIDVFGSYPKYSVYFRTEKKVCDYILPFEGFEIKTAYVTNENKVFSLLSFSKDKRMVIHATDDSDIYIAYDNKDDELVPELVKKFKMRKKKGKANIHLLSKDSGGFSLIKSTVEPSKLSVSFTYGPDFKPVHDDIVSKLKHKSSGILLLHGEPGTGKTSYIKYLLSIVRNRRFVIVPNHIVDHLSSPEMINFLLNNENLVLIFEDAEEAIKARNTGGHNSVASLLNLSDGLIGSAINCSVIVTFNAPIANIDSALMRKGRLIAEHKFGKLSIEDSNALLTKLGKKHVATEPMLLTDIYNVDGTLFKEEPKRRVIGFQREETARPKTAKELLKEVYTRKNY